MDRSKQVAVGIVGAVVVLAAVFFLMQGDGSAPGDDSVGAQSGDNNCQSDGFPGQPGDWAGVVCQKASGAATFTDTWPCEKPSESAVGGSLQNATAGTLTATVEDATGSTVFEDTFQAGAHPVGAPIGQGEAGEWTLTVELSEDWESNEFGIGASCGRADGSGGSTSSSSACQTVSDQQMSGQSRGQISCRDQQGEESLQATFQCDVPEEGAANWDADIQAGQADIKIVDADGQAVVDETLENDESKAFVPFEGAAAGEFTMTAELTSDFEGSFNFSGQCSTE